MTQKRAKERHIPPGLIRRIVGWIVIVAGIAMLVLPGPGILGIALGIMLLGRNDPTLRRWSVRIRMLLRRMSQSRQQALRSMGQALREHHRRSRLFIREQVHRHASGQPLSRTVQLWIGLTLLGALIAIGASAMMLQRIIP